MRKFKFKFFIFAAIAIFVIAHQDWDDSSNQTKQTQISSQSAARSALAQQGQNSKTTNRIANWPMLKDDESGQTVANNLLAKNYYFVVDGSGSMHNIECSDHYTKMEAAKIALTEFARNIPTDANVGVVAFDRKGTSERMALQPKNESAFNTAVQQVTYGGGTPLLSSIDIALQKITEQGRRQLGYGEYNIIIVTDGAASEGQDPTPLVNEIINESPVLIHTIGFCLNENHSLNQPGRTYYKAANNIESLRQGLGDILAESEQFTVTDFQ
ncbi:MAG: VWA domain-containing protein [Gammaproteobacteria bacterium]|nr:MAG: VWA domain-containing protein [Gammaproteobacteria bacterium]